MANTALSRDDNQVPVGWKGTNIKTATTTVVKASAGILHSITLNTPVASAVIAVYDNASGAGTTIATITFAAALTGGPDTLIYDTAFTNGLTVITTGTPDITVNYI